MNTLYGYGISLLFFITGISLPSERADNAPAPSQSHSAASLRAADALGDEQRLVAAYGLQSLPSLEPVRNDHSGRRAKVPTDPSMRCPELEPVLKAYGLVPVQTWSYIAWRESGCNPAAQNAKWDANGNMTYALNKNKSYDTGLVQINSSWRSVTIKVCGESAVDNRMQGLKTVHCNLMVARYIMEHSSGGLSNWRM